MMPPKICIYTIGGDGYPVRLPLMPCLTYIRGLKRGIRLSQGLGYPVTNGSARVNLRANSYVCSASHNHEKQLSLRD